MTIHSRKSSGMVFLLMLCISFSFWLTTGCASAPSPALAPTIAPSPVLAPTIAPSPAPSPVNLQFKFVFPTPGTEYKPDDIGKPMTISGTHNLSPEDHVWIFLRDIYRGYYLQNPSVELRADGKWDATNIRLGREIDYIVAIYVNSEGNTLIQGWVDGNQFGRKEEKEIRALPGYLELGRVNVKTPGSQ